ncbi:uncharacterized protein LOC111353940 isoform X2 [Spodoptera litura]|uniref:Uncharacterized protein LOC111353940 isoform X2 n=1 Tax=Spodoptera litura TaxID=69820 RepID=A0A9J7E2K9_SPOLT|nr:uncharacterized protein LOC111353940 isoform X2 [Spodoptera litura]
MFWSTLITLACMAAYAHGHGKVIDPVNRASLWRVFSDEPADFSDAGLNCGGFGHQWRFNKGRCGVCGDPYDSPQPRAHEYGGKYGQGRIVATYQQGDVITTKVDLSASHLGYWEFRLCVDPEDNTQECYDRHVLELVEGGTKYYPTKPGIYTVEYHLPSNVVCEHCVLQWKYTAGNNWGVCADGSGALGCGNQENFFSCSDITIKRSESIPLDVPIVNFLNGEGHF